MEDEPWDLSCQPKLASRSEVVSIYKCPPPHYFGLSQNVGRKNLIFTTFFATSTLDTAYLRNETPHRQTKMLVSP